MPTLQAAIDARGAKVGAAKFEQATQQIISSSTKANSGIGRVDRGIKKLGKTASSAKKILGGLFVGLGAAAVLRKTVSTLVSFENTMLTVKGVTGATEQQFQKLSDTARQLGATTRWSATQTGEGLLFLSRAGFSVEESIAALPATLNLATAGALELGAAADIASNILSQFNLEATDTERVVDTLVHTSNSANTNVLQLAEAMKMAGPVAGALGISIEETAAAIGALGDAGIQGTMAGTQLRGTFAALLGPTTKARKVLKEMGVTIESINPATHTFVEVLGTLADANITAAQAVQIFGRRNAAGILVMTQSVDKIRELTLENIIAQGEAARLAKVMDSGLGGAFKNLKSIIEEVMLQFSEGTGFGGALKKMTNTVTNVIRVFAGMEDSITEGAAAAKIFARTLEFVAKVTVLVIGLKIVLWAKAVTIAFITAGTSVTFLAGALETLRLVMMLHPILTWAVILGTLYIAFTTFTSSVDKNSKALREQRKEWDKLASLIPRVTTAQGDYNKAIAEGDILGQVEGLRSKIASLEAVKSLLHEEGEQSIRYEDMLQYLDPNRRANLRTAHPFGDRPTETKRLFGILPITAPTQGDVPIAEAEALALLNTQQEVYKKTIEDLSGAVGKLAKAKADVAEKKIFERDELDNMERAKETLEELAQTLKDKIQFSAIFDAGLKKSLEFERSVERLTKEAKLHGEEQRKVVEALINQHNIITETEAKMKKIREDSTRIKAGQKGINQIIKSLEDQVQILGKINEKRTIEVALVRARNIAQQAGIILTESQLRAITDLTSQVYKLQEADRLRQSIMTDSGKVAEDTLRNQKLLTDSIGKSIGDMFASMVTGAKSAQIAIRDLATEILSLIVQRTIANPIADAISGSLMGGGSMSITSSGAVPYSAPAFVGPPSPFAMGGVVSKPTLSLTGESGPEAILPLTRGAGGRLGVQALGGGSAIKISIVNESSSVEAKQGNTEFNGREWVTQIILSDKENYGPISQVMGARR